jgi:ABC-type transport system substrate-binding protein
MHLIRAASLALFATLLAGCNNDPNPAPLQQKRADGKPWVVRYWYTSDEIRSLDPQVSADQVSDRIIEPVQESLLEYHPMKLDPYEVVPCLLETLPEKTANADGSVSYLCRLKKGIMYHDDPCFPGGKGRELVAEDVHFVFQRLSDPAVQSPVYGSLAEYVAGMSAAYAEAEKTTRFDYDKQRIRGIEVIDSHTFKIHLVRSYPQIVYWLAMHFTAPVAREAVEYYDGKEHDGKVRPLFKFHLVGTGPFKVAEWVRNQRWRLVRNENYKATTFPTEGWPPEREAKLRPLAGKPLPLVDEVQITIFRELLPMWLLTRQGYLDSFGVMKDAVNSVVTASAELAPKYAERGMRLDRLLEVSTFFMVFNMQDPLLGSNKKLRQALSCSYDPRGYIEMLYGGVAPVAEQLIPPGIFGHDKNFKNPYGTNLEKGRRLLAEAGYPNGIDPRTGRPLEITMDVVATGGEERQLAEYEQRQFEQLGIRMRVIENTFARIMEKEDQGNFQIAAGSGWGADYPDAENFQFLFYSGNFPPQGKNAGRYKNPEFDQLFEKSSTMENTPERLAMLRRMNDIMVEDCPMIPTFHKGYYTIEQPWAPIAQKNTLIQGGGIKYTSVNPELREQKRREWNPKPKWPIGVALGVVALGVVYGVRVNRRRVVV